MQKVSFVAETPRYDAKAVIERINKLSDFFRNNGDKVIHIQHNGSSEEFCIPNSEEWEIIDGIHVRPQDIRIDKTANDCFYNSELEPTLNLHGIKEIVITGCATDYCVDTTIRSAFSKEYHITVIENAHTTADRPHLKAEKVIEHHNYVWADMTAIKGVKISLQSCNSYLSQD